MILARARVLFSIPPPFASLRSLSSFDHSSHPLRASRARSDAAHSLRAGMVSETRERDVSLCIWSAPRRLRSSPRRTPRRIREASPRANVAARGVASRRLRTRYTRARTFYRPPRAIGRVRVPRREGSVARERRGGIGRGTSRARGVRRGRSRGSAGSRRERRGGRGGSGGSRRRMRGRRGRGGIGRGPSRSPGR